MQSAKNTYPFPAGRDWGVTVCDNPVRPGTDRERLVDGQASEPTILVIGRADAATAAYLRGVSGTSIACVLVALDAAMLDRLAPDLVVFPLMTRDFDATQVLQRLRQIGYRGTARVVTGALPDRGMVLRELRSHAPGIDLDLIEHPSD